jgi:hypothetical protein
MLQSKTSLRKLINSLFKEKNYGIGILIDSNGFYNQVSLIGGKWPVGYIFNLATIERYHDKLDKRMSRGDLITEFMKYVDRDVNEYYWLRK